MEDYEDVLKQLPPDEAAIVRIMLRYKEQVRQGFSDPDHVMNLSEIEALAVGSIQDTMDIVKEETRKEYQKRGIDIETGKPISTENSADGEA